MKKTITFLCLLILVTITVNGQAITPTTQELHAGARSFQEGKFQEARQAYITKHVTKMDQLRVLFLCVHFVEGCPAPVAEPIEGFSNSDARGATRSDRGA